MNPNSIQKTRSPLAGVKKGNVPWNVGQSDPSKAFDRLKKIVEDGDLGKFCEAVSRRYAKTYLIGTVGNKCSICGITDWMGKPVPLVCDHISGDSTDNSIENFRLVCCNCDAQLPTFKSKNRGKGRSYDRQYRQKKNETNVTE
jgi:hypothetical protein